MKLHLFILTGLTVILSFIDLQVSAQKISYFSGRWVNTDSVKLIDHITFGDSTNVIVNFPGQGIVECTYKADTTKDPIWFDLYIKVANDNKPLKGLVKFIDANTLKWQLFLGVERPADFVEETKKNTVILKRAGRN